MGILYFFFYRKIVLEVFFCILFFFLFCATGYGFDVDALSLEELMNATVTSASKKEQQINKVPTAIYTVSGEDVIGVGAHSLPEALRMVPGINVSQVDTDRWAVSARGLETMYSNKLQVLVDGRSIYTHFYSGVLWDMHDIIFEDMQAMEVIRGPGASLWGSNAVNGVINIETKHARDTQGWYMKAVTNTKGSLLGSLRYGGNIGDSSYYRVYGNYEYTEPLPLVSGFYTNIPNQTALRGGAIGVRTDTDMAESHFTFHGKYTQKNATSIKLGLQPTSFPYAKVEEDEYLNADGYIMGKFTHNYSEDSSYSIQAYYNYLKTDVFDIDAETHVGNVEFQQQIRVHEIHDIVWGAKINMGIEKSSSAEIIPITGDDDFTYSIMSVFIQDEITVVEDVFFVTLGTKLSYESNPYNTKIYAQPTIRGLWRVTDDTSLWAAVSNAVRVPSRVNLDTDRVVGGVVATHPPVVTTFTGNNDFDAEDMWAYELGLRSQVHEKLFMDLALFYNRYSDIVALTNFVPMSSRYPGYAEMNSTMENARQLETYGGELAVHFTPLPWWKLIASGAYVYLDYGEDDDYRSPLVLTSRFTGSLQSLMHLRDNLDFAVWFHYTEGVKQAEYNVDIDDYLSLDVRLAWQATEHLELAVGGKNLLKERHQETVYDWIHLPRAEVERVGYLEFTWKF